MRQFGQAGKAPGVPTITLAQMAKDYAAGKFGDNAKPDNAYAKHKGKGGGVSAMAH
jgi:fructose-bisphosphate aldolase, class II